MGLPGLRGNVFVRVEQGADPDVLWERLSHAASTAPWDGGGKAASTVLDRMPSFPPAKPIRSCPKPLPTWSFPSSLPSTWPHHSSGACSSLFLEALPA